MTRCLARERERTFFLLKKPRNVTLSKSLSGSERMEPGERKQRTTLCTAPGWGVEGRVGKHTILPTPAGGKSFRSVTALLYGPRFPSQNSEAALEDPQTALGLAVNQTCS